MLAWHFLRSDRMMRDGQGPVNSGDVYTHAGPIEICASGLHASERLIDALRYAPGCVVQRVECRDVTDAQPDKLVCRERRTLWLADARPVLVTFARWCAYRAADAARGRAYAARAAAEAYASAEASAAAYACAAAYASDAASAAACACATDHVAAAETFERNAQNAELTRLIVALEPRQLELDL